MATITNWSWPGSPSGHGHDNQVVMITDGHGPDNDVVMAMITKYNHAHDKHVVIAMIIKWSWPRWYYAPQIVCELEQLVTVFGEK
ncbi:hypothetical protein TNCT_71251 [Trichonephila clavata]|uniref:Uncharacterized protein n=1 Tax=Trichonephila clavata TaxID=2740835 RepID=A0A8X6HEZ7_TRICU|nr:hypothetical protein TNCT_71251 [Trichonephila clavata]